MKMEKIDFIAEAIQYQKSTSDQIFEVLSLCRRNSDTYILEALDQLQWMPEQSKAGYQAWSSNYDNTLNQLKEFVDQSFLQMEQVFSFAEGGLSGLNAAVVKPQAKASETRVTVTKRVSVAETGVKAAVKAVAKPVAKPAASKTAPARKKAPVATKAAAKPATKTAARTTKRTTAAKPAAKRGAASGAKSATAKTANAKATK